jgi:hypothetical protein
MMNHSKVAEDLLNDFLRHVRALGGDVEPVKVLRSNTYRVGNSHVLARVAADTGKYFFGLNYINAEEVANLCVRVRRRRFFCNYADVRADGAATSD